MKKQICTAIIGALATVGVYGQGYIFFNDATVHLYDNFTTPGTPTADALMKVGYIWDAGSGGQLTALGASGSTQVNPLASNPWPSLTALTGGWSWGSPDGVTPTAVATAGSPPPLAGTFNGGTVAVNGSTAGEAITMYVVAWNSAYATPAAAAAAGSAIGWSTPFNWTTGTSTSPGSAITGSLSSFYVDLVPTATPEPGTLALAALGGAAMLFIRRKK
jgi:hypothetical protein